MNRRDELEAQLRDEIAWLRSLVRDLALSRPTPSAAPDEELYDPETLAAVQRLAAAVTGQPSDAVVAFELGRQAERHVAARTTRLRLVRPDEGDGAP